MPLAGNAITSACFVVAGANVTRCACAMLCSRRNGRTFSLPARRRLCVRASAKQLECLRPFRCSASQTMPQIVMCDAIRADLFARAIKRLLAFADPEHFRVQRLASSFAPHSFKQCASIGNQRNAAQFPILRAGLGVATHNDFAGLKIDIPPFERVRLALAHPVNGQALREVGAVYRIATVAGTHLRNKCVEFVGARQRNFFPANGGAFQSRCGIAVNHTGFDCDGENVSKERECVVVVSRRRRFCVRARPLFAVGLRDLANLRFVQSGPAFDERGKALSPIVARPRFDAHIVIEIAEMNRSGLAKRHLGGDFAIAIAGALTVFFEEFRQPRLSHAEM